MLFYAMFISTFTINGISDQTIDFYSKTSCEKAKVEMIKTLDKLNETTNLGYSIQCLEK